MLADKFFAHPSAIIDERASVGQGSKIWVNVQIREYAEVGRFCNLGKDVYVDIGVKIGDFSKIQNSTSVYSGVTLEKSVFIGPNVTFTNDRIPRAFNETWEIIPTLVREGASIGANATIVCGIVIGSFAMIGAGAVVTKDVPDFTLVYGNPARPVARIDRSGARVVSL